MPSKTSLMEVMSPRHWGFEKVRIFYNEVRVADDQDTVKAGEHIRDLKTGIVWEFVSRENNTLNLIPVLFNK
jgi:hypothetical protein